MITGGVANYGGGAYNFVLPILLDQVLKVFSVGRSRVWNIVIGKPALQLCFMTGFDSLPQDLTHTGLAERLAAYG